MIFTGPTAPDCPGATPPMPTAKSASDSWPPGSISSGKSPPPYGYDFATAENALPLHRHRRNRRGSAAHRRKCPPPGQPDHQQTGVGQPFRPRPQLCLPGAHRQRSPRPPSSGSCTMRRANPAGSPPHTAKRRGDHPFRRTVCGNCRPAGGHRLCGYRNGRGGLRSAEHRRLRHDSAAGAAVRSLSIPSCRPLCPGPAP